MDAYEPASENNLRYLRTDSFHASEEQNLRQTNRHGQVESDVRAFRLEVPVFKEPSLTLSLPSSKVYILPTF